MNVVTDPKQAGERLLQFAREGRIVQGTWHDEEDGREVACLLGAAAGIFEAYQCPASLMPQWMSHALPALFDGQAEAHAQTFARRWGEAMVRDEWVRIEWDAVRAEWMAFVVRQAKAAAAANAADASYYADDAYCAAAAAAYATRAAANAAASAASAASAAYATRAATSAAVAARADARAAARDAQADELMDAIERAMEVARG